MLLNSKDADEVSKIVECIRCVRALMNNKVGLNAILNSDDMIKSLALCLDFPESMELRYRHTVLELLTVICGARHDGHRFVFAKHGSVKT